MHAYILLSTDSMVYSYYIILGKESKEKVNIISPVRG